MLVLPHLLSARKVTAVHFQVEPCMRQDVHEFDQCDFVHPGEKARRRDPRIYHYQAISCPDYRKGVCKRGDACPYAHGVFELWMHPSKFRSHLCNAGANCKRPRCFFAHSIEELRVPFAPSLTTNKQALQPAMQCMVKPALPVHPINTPLDALMQTSNNNNNLIPSGMWHQELSDRGSPLTPNDLLGWGLLQPPPVPDLSAQLQDVLMQLLAMRASG